jgi:predicted O-methyltransferase YrrM
MSFVSSAIHALAFVAGKVAPETQTTPREQAALRAYADGRGRAIEIGVFEGFNTRLIAEALRPGGVLYAIDPFYRGRLPICWGELIARRHVGRSGVENRVRFVKALSWEAKDRIEGAFDLIFVDGDHSWSGISRDWADWSERVAPGGVIAMHDTCLAGAHPSAASLDCFRFFEEVIAKDPRFEVVEQVDTLTFLSPRRP